MSLAINHFPRPNLLAVKTAIWRTALGWILLIPMLWLAGASWSSSQDRAEGDVLAATAPQDPVTRIAWVVSYALMAAAAYSSFSVLWPSLKKNLWIPAVLGLSAISVVWSQDPVQTMKMSFFLIVSTLFAVWIAARIPAEQQMQLTILVGAFAAIISIILALFLPSIGLDKFEEDTWQGMFYSKNHCGRMMLFFLIPAFHYKWNGSSKIVKYLYMALVMGVIVMSRSKTSWIITILYLCLALALKVLGRFSRKSMFTLVLAALPLLGLSSLLLFQNLDAILAAFGRNATLSQRTVIWKELIVSVMKRPIEGYGYHAFWTGTTGEGFNVFVAVYSKIHFAATYAHSGYFDVLIQLGLLGMAIIALSLVRACKNAVTCFRNERDSATDWYIGMISITILFNIDEVTFLLPNYLPWMLYVVACISLAARARRKASVAHEEKNSSTRELFPLPGRTAPLTVNAE